MVILVTPTSISNTTHNQAFTSFLGKRDLAAVMAEYHESDPKFVLTTLVQVQDSLVGSNGGRDTDLLLHSIKQFIVLSPQLRIHGETW